MNEQALANAVAFAEWGFPVFSVWGVEPDGACKCPAGQSCTNKHGKHPIPRDGFKAGTTDVERVRTMLKAAGSGGQYGVVPAPHTIIIDADGENFADRVKELGLTNTLIVRSGNGLHLYFYWPDDYGPVPTHLFGWKVRSNDHLGYVVGPGSTHAETQKQYRVHKMNGHDMHDMLATITNFPRELVPEPALKLVVGEGPRVPETILEGSRHDFLRDRARTLRGGGLTGDDLFAAVSALNRRLPQPKTDEEVRRAIGDVETKFSEDPMPMEAIEQVIEALTVHPFIFSATDYRAAQPTKVDWVSPLAAYGYVSLISGPPKSGKSTLMSNLLAAREAGRFFLWGDPVPKGPTILVTEEAGVAVVQKISGLTNIDVLDRRNFALAGLTKLSHLLAALQSWADPDQPSLIVIDTFAVWGDIKDENDAVAATKAIAALTLLAQTLNAAIVLIHHSRKGGGDYGESIRGSNAIFGAVDISIEFKYFENQTDTRRKVTLSGRFESSTSETLDFNTTTREYERIYATPSYDELTKHIPLESSGLDGMTRDDLKGIWGKDPRHDIDRLKKAGVIVERLTKVGRVTKTIYFKAPPLLDARPVGTRMEDIIRGGDSDES